MPDEAEKENVECRDVHEVWSCFFVPGMDCVFVDAEDHEWKESFENVFWQVVKNVFSKLMVSKILA